MRAFAPSRVATIAAQPAKINRPNARRVIAQRRHSEVDMNQHALTRCFTLAGALALSFLAASAHAQNYPDRPVKIISDSAPGSAIDSVLRIIGDRLGRGWGQQVIV